MASPDGGGGAPRRDLDALLAGVGVRPPIAAGRGRQGGGAAPAGDHRILTGPRGERGDAVRPAAALTSPHKAAVGGAIAADAGEGAADQRAREEPVHGTCTPHMAPPVNNQGPPEGSGRMGRPSSTPPRWLVPLLVGALLAVMSPHARAQDLEPRAYANTPVGLNFLIAGYTYSRGGVATDPSVPLNDAAIQVHGGVLAYARALGVLGQSAKVDVVLPLARISGSATFAGEPREREVSGLGDPRVRFSLNFYGAPALSLTEFADYEQDLIIGASLQVSVPLGQYEADKLVNVGTHRWSVKPELGVSKAFGKLTLELLNGVTFYTDNDDFLGDKTRTQDPIYSVQGHVIYSFGHGIWAALDGTYYMGGRTTVDGVKGDDRQGNTRVGATVALPVSRHHSIKLYASHGVSTRTGSDFDTVGMAWQFRWGGGL